MMNEDMEDIKDADKTIQLPPSEATFASLQQQQHMQLTNLSPSQLTASSLPASLTPPSSLIQPNHSNSTNSNSTSATSSSTSSGASSTSLSPSISHITQLIEDLRSPDLPTRLIAFHSLPLIANALGPLRSREELLPYLEEFVDEDDDILAVLAVELANLIDPIGGVAYSHLLLSPLEHLAATEESTVRDKAINSILSIIKAMTDHQIETYILPLLRTLTLAEWFTSRMSACSLYAAVYPRVSINQKKDLRTLFAKLCSDDTPMVRRSACSALGSFSQVVEYSAVRQDLFPSFLKLAKDDQDSVRLLTINSSIQLSHGFKSADNITKMLPVVFNLCQDKSWRVRYMIADRFCDLCVGLGGGESKSDDLVDGFVRLLQDDEPEVRTAAATRVGEVAKLVGPNQTIKKLTPSLKILAKDNSPYVRAALASTLMSIATVIKKRETVEQLLPLFLGLLKDSNSEVRLNLISRLESVQEILSVDMLSQSLLPAIMELASDQKWRVRLQIISHIPALGKQLGSDFFDSKLSELCMNWLGDPVYSIREAATNNLTQLVNVYGITWAKLHILPKVISLATHRQYLFRMTAVTAMLGMSGALGLKTTIEKLVPVLVKLSTDNVPNVRIGVVRGVKGMIERGELGSKDGKEKESILNPSLATREVNEVNASPLGEDSMGVRVDEKPSNQGMNSEDMDNEDLASIYQEREKAINSLITSFQRCVNDNDTDVKYYAKLALVDLQNII